MTIAAHITLTKIETLQFSYQINLNKIFLNDGSKFVSLFKKNWILIFGVQNKQRFLKYIHGFKHFDVCYVYFCRLINESHIIRDLTSLKSHRYLSSN